MEHRSKSLAIISSQPDHPTPHTEAMFRAAAKHGYRVLSSGRVDGAALLAEQYQIIKDAYRAEGVPLANAHITVMRDSADTSG
jgi:predicted secreted protein